MSLAKVIRFTESGDHVLVFMSKHAFDTSSTVGYVRNNVAFDGKKAGDTVECPDGWHVTQRMDKDNKVMATKEGEPLSFFAW